MSSTKYVYSADFETTTDTNLAIDGYVRVYLWSLVNCESMKDYMKDPQSIKEYQGFSISTFLDKIKELRAKTIFFHNLKFDGQFILDYLLRRHWQIDKDYSVIVDNRNSWYEIKLNFDKFSCRIWDSGKKFPGHSVKTLAKLYGFSDKEESPDFNRYLPWDYVPSDIEKEYNMQDSRIVAYAIEMEYEKGHNSLTLSSDAFKDVKDKCLNGRFWRDEFPLLTGMTDSFARDSYKGGYVYLKPEYDGVELHNVTTFDVNSLYPHVMRNLLLPYGVPEFRPHRGDELYVTRFSCNFDLKDGYLPTLQIKNCYRNDEAEYLTHSNDSTILTMTNIDYNIFKKHYDIYDESDHEDLCVKSKIGLLQPYIDYWYEKKISCKKDGKVINPAEYYMSKRYLNSPYGKTGMKGDRINKIPFYDVENNRIGWNNQEESVDSIYVLYATFVCAQARNITITAAQNNYDSFIYGDTDSIHLLTDNAKGIDISDTKLGAFKQENKIPWDYAKYLKAKTYCHAMKEDNEIKIKEVRVAGLNNALSEMIKWDDFKYGYQTNENKKIFTVPGGCVIRKTRFHISQ